MKNATISLSLLLAIILLLSSCGSPAQLLSELRTDEMEQLIFTPLLNAKLLESSWANTTELSADKMLAYYKFSNNPEQENIKAKTVEKKLTEAFGVTPTLLQSSPLYNADKKTYDMSLIEPATTTGSLKEVLTEDTIIIEFEIESSKDIKNRGTLLLSGETVDDIRFLSCVLEEVESEPKSEPEKPFDVKPPTQKTPPETSPGKEESSLGSPENPIAEEPQDPGTEDVPPVDPQVDAPDIPTEGHDIGKSDPDAPLGSPENPIAEEPQDPGEDSPPLPDGDTVVEP